jgi:hypothetical protein
MIAGVSVFADRFSLTELELASKSFRWTNLAAMRLE